MLLLTVRTDKPEAEIGLYNDEDQIAYMIWPAHRELSMTIHLKIKELLESKNLELSDLNGLVVFKGPGSFTGLRIGLSVANALAYSFNLPIVSEMDENWISKGVKRIISGDNEVVSLPEYGREPHITQQKK